MHNVSLPIVLCSLEAPASSLALYNAVPLHHTLIVPSFQVIIQDVMTFLSRIEEQEAVPGSEAASPSLEAMKHRRMPRTGELQALEQKFPAYRII